MKLQPIDFRVFRGQKIMLISCFLICFVLCGFHNLVYAESYLDATDILPDLPNYTRMIRMSSYRGEEIYEYIPHKANLFIEFGLEKIVTQDYINEDKKSIFIDIYQFPKSENAFGVFSFYRLEGEKLKNIGNEAIQFPKRIDFWQANFYIRIETYYEGFDEDLIGFAKATSNLILFSLSSLSSDDIDTSSNNLTFLKIFPKDNLRNLYYLIGTVALENLIYIADDNILQISPTNPCFVGEYVFNNNISLKPFIIHYQNNIANLIWENLLNYKGDCINLEIVEHKKDYIIYQEGNSYQFFHSIKNEYILFLLDIENEEIELARDLLKRIKYNL